jgi:hypothetical protein
VKTALTAKAESIANIRKRFHREWLLIALDKVDEDSTTPLTGTLLAHSPRRAAIHRKVGARPKRLYVVYSDDDFPKGYAAAFRA